MEDNNICLECFSNITDCHCDEFMYDRNISFPFCLSWFCPDEIESFECSATTTPFPTPLSCVNVGQDAKETGGEDYKHVVCDIKQREGEAQSDRGLCPLN
jgi:hypothetical protein